MIEFNFCWWHLQGFISLQEPFYFGGGEYEHSYFICMGHDHGRYSIYNRRINRRSIVMKLLDDEKTLKDEPTVAVVTWGGGFSLVN